MPSRLQALILEDEERWRQEISEVLEELGEAIEFTLCRDLESAQSAIEAKVFDLAFVDFSLLDPPADLEGPIRPEDRDDLGIDFLEALRNHAKNRFCAVVVLTGTSTTQRLKLVLTRYAVHDVLEKGISDDAIVRAAKEAMRDARSRRAESVENQTPTCALRLGEQTVQGARLQVKDRRSEFYPEQSRKFPWESWVNHADLIGNVAYGAEPGAWRQHARDLGSQLYRKLSEVEGVREILASADFAGASGSTLRYRFASPSEALGIPFEMCRHGENDEPICLAGPVSRQVVFPDQVSNGCFRPFHHFVAELGVQKKALRALFVAANANGDLAEVDREVEVLARQIAAELEMIGIKFEPEVILSADASRNRVRELLSQQSFHLFHFAGHAKHRPGQPEKSGLELRDGLMLSAADLKLRVEKTPLRLVFLSACRGSQTAPRSGLGDYNGILEALARGGVPAVVGYRWDLADSAALALAANFYRFLIRTFSPEEALFKARWEAAQETGEENSGRNDPTWLSPILLNQT